MESKVVSMDHRFAALRDKNEDDMEKFTDAVATLSADIASLKDQMFTLWDQIASLESFLREQSKENNKPFWKR
jgi:peptidoglycan hydrolase CwlO-like protein